MAGFDHDLWMQRAQERRDRAVERGTPEQKANLTHAYELVNIDSLRVVVEWALSRSLTVDFTKEGDGRYSPDDKKITVSGRASPVVQLHVILHECGHHLVGDDEKRERYRRGYADNGANNKKTLRHRLDILEEEFEAWHRGLKLAKRLGVPLDKKAYDRTRDKFLKSYVDWVAKYRKRKRAKKNEQPKAD